MAKGLDLSKEITDILNSYSDEVREVVDATTQQEGYKAVSRVKRAIDGAGIKGNKYKKSIAAKSEKGRLYNTVTIHARAPHYRLTHLLENGHVIRNKYGTYGRTKARPHWEVAEKETVEAYTESIISAVEKIK